MTIEEAVGVYRNWRLEHNWSAWNAARNRGALQSVGSSMGTATGSAGTSMRHRRGYTPVAANLKLRHGGSQSRATTLKDRLKNPAFKATHDKLIASNFKHRFDPENPKSGTAYTHKRLRGYLHVYPDGKWSVGSLVDGKGAGDLTKLRDTHLIGIN